ncbi:polysaccharide deacetylase family protein [Paenibacillus sp. UMB4589-SE434]|nr:polysaccharide deacetylase family protein [Paenibacillus sp. UMB4589-SE434]
MDKMGPNIRKAITVIMSCIFVLAIVRLTEVGSFIKEQKTTASWMHAFDSNEQSVMVADPLMERIMDIAKSRTIQPINATIDRVWKAIPGYNGLEVDVEQSYALNKRVDETKMPLQLAYRETEPTVTLSQLPPSPVFKGNSNKPMAALMINVAWGNEFIEPILETLQSEQVKATFFFDGSWLTKNPELAKAIYKAGHEVGNHAYTHPNMSTLSEGLQHQEIAKTEKVVKATFGVNSKWFAPPSGDFNALTVRTAASLGMRTVMWTFDTLDWRHPSPATIVQRLRAKLEAGTLILMHPTSSSSSALQSMIHVIKQKKLALGTVSEILSEKRHGELKVEP